MTLDRRAQSEVIGPVLLVGFVVVAAASVGTLAVAQFVTTATSDEPAPALGADATSENLTLVHGGGADLRLAEVEVVLENETESVRFRLADATVEGDGDGQFEPGERARKAHAFGAGSTVDLLVVDTASERVVVRAELTLPAETAG